MSDKKEEREALTHFELYRLIKNFIESESQSNPRYVDVNPEETVGTGSADLVIEAAEAGVTSKFAVIEVKRPTDQSILVFGDRTTEQAHNYANQLGTEFFATTDGKVLRLFETKDSKELGSHSINNLNASFVRSLLGQLQDISSGKLDSLNFPIYSMPTAKMNDMTAAVDELLSTLFDEIKTKPPFKIVMQGNVRHLSVGKADRILGLEQHPAEPAKNAFTIWIDRLSRAAGDKLPQIMKSLSEIEGLAWVTEPKWEEKRFTWRLVKDIAVEDPNLDKMKKDLLNWLYEVENVCR